MFVRYKNCRQLSLWFLVGLMCVCNVACVSAFVPTLNSLLDMKGHSLLSISPRNRRASTIDTPNHILGALRSKKGSSDNSTPLSSTFSKESLTTQISPITRFGPFGSGGTVVGFSKYKAVRAAFEENFARRLELGAQLVIYEDGEKIVDLYGFAPEEENYDGETLQPVASSGKNMEAIAVAMLVDRGLVSYDDLVQKHWPEFGANGKQKITIADVMRHAGGVPFVIDSNSNNYPNDIIPITTEDILAVHPMENKISGAEKYPPDNKTSCYHALTRGFIINGILRRVDPSGRSLGQFLSEEVTDPLSKINDNQLVKFFCGIPEEEQSNYTYANWTIGSILYVLFIQIFPALLGFNKQLAAYLKFNILKDGLRSFTKAVVYPTFFFNYIKTPNGRSIEFPSGGMFANARSMALINAAAMAGDGSIHGVHLLKQSAVQNSMDQTITKHDEAFGVTLGFTQGGYCSFKESFSQDDDHYGNSNANSNGNGNKRSSNPLFHPDDQTAYGKFKGWGGVGGSLSLVDREINISLAYCMNGFGTDALWGVRTRRILLEVQKAIRPDE